MPNAQPDTSRIPVFTLTRTFDAPRDAVFEACSDPAQIASWWGPKGMPTTTARMEFRPGGAFHYCTRTPDGHEMWGTFAYREIVAPERIVFTNSFSNPQGEITRAPFADDWPLEVWNVWTFTEKDGRTTLSLEGSPHDASEAECARFEAMKPSLQQGFSGTFDQLAEHFSKHLAKR